MSDVDALVNRVLMDESFARQLAENTEQTLRNAGMEPTPEMLDALRDLDADALQRMARAFKAGNAAY